MHTSLLHKPKQFFGLDSRLVKSKLTTAKQLTPFEKKYYFILQKQVSDIFTALFLIGIFFNDDAVRRAACASCDAGAGAE